MQAGKTFGKYRIVRLLGRGGMGSVYLAEDETLGRDVALKVLDRAVTAEVDFESRFRREAQLVAGLKHPRIIPIHSLEQIDGTMAIDMPYVEGGSLAEAEARGRLRFQQVVARSRDVLEALACCHDAGIVHRDVKPSNILLGEDGRGLLSDFGLAKLLAARHREAMHSTASSSFFVGTPRFAPPESWDGCDPTPAWDVYSVGAILYEAATGAPPYAGETPYLLIKEMVERPVTPLLEAADGVSSELAALVDAMLAQNVAERPQEASKVLDQLVRVPELGGPEGGGGSTLVRVAAPKMGPAQRRARRQRIRRFGLQSLVALGVVLAFAGGLGWGVRSGGFSVPPGTSAPATPGTPYRVYDTFDPISQAHWPNHWLMEPGETAGTWNVLAFEGTHLWFMSATTTEDTVTLDGHWAEYMDPSARVFRHGTLTGTGQVLTNGADMMVSLEFWCELDGMQWTQSLALTSASAPMTDVAFLQGWEDDSHMQALACNELVPRGLPWLGDLEKRVLSRSSPRTVVPFLNKGASPIAIDGRLDETGWRVAFSNAEAAHGRIAVEEAPGEAEMLLRYDARGLFVGIHLDCAVPAARVSLTLMNAFHIPLKNSPRFAVQFEEAGITAYRRLLDGKPVAWDCSWQGTISAVGEGLEAEVFLPFESLGYDKAPVAGTRWRLNGMVHAGDGGGEAPVARWGSEEVDRAEHGVLLVFGLREGA